MILREFKNDDRAALRALSSGLRRNPGAPAVERATALAALVELSTVLDEPHRVPEWGEQLRLLDLSCTERDQVTAFVAGPALIEPWLPI